MRDGARTGLIGRRAERPSSTAPARAGQEDGHSGVVVVRGRGRHREDRTAQPPRRPGRRLPASCGRPASSPEMELSYAGLHQLCAPLLSHLDDLPGPQRTALRTAFGMRAGDAPDRFLVRTRHAQPARRPPPTSPCCAWSTTRSGWTACPPRPWSSSHAACPARRIGAAGPRPSASPAPARPWPPCPNSSSTASTNRTRHSSSTRSSPARSTRWHGTGIVAETRGNLLALLELPRGLTAMEMAGGFDGPAARPLAGQIEAGYLRRIQALPARGTTPAARRRPRTGRRRRATAAGRRTPRHSVDSAVTQAEASGFS